jgi:hypothetical protein
VRCDDDECTTSLLTAVIHRTSKEDTSGKACGRYSKAIRGVLEAPFQAIALKSAFNEYFRTLYTLLTFKQSLPADVLARIAEIVHYMQRRQYQKANDSYLRLSIGNAPWPIGVTMVGYVSALNIPPATAHRHIVSMNVLLERRSRQIRLLTC